MVKIFKLSEQYASEWPGSKYRGIFKKFNPQTILIDDPKFSCINYSRENQGEVFFMEK